MDHSSGGASKIRATLISRVRDGAASEEVSGSDTEGGGRLDLSSSHNAPKLHTVGSITSTFKHLRACFSPFGSDSDIIVVGYVMFEFASRVCIFNFNILSPLLIAELGDQAFEGKQGKVIWGYVAAIAAILTVLVYLSLTPVMEFGNMKRDTLIKSSYICAVLHICYLLCFFQGAIYLAIPLMIFAKITQRVSDVAFNALLDVVAHKKDAHQISSRCNITGYVGMLLFLAVAAAILWVINSLYHPPKLWMQGTIPVFLTGVWFYGFTRVIDDMLPAILGDNLPLPKEIGSGLVGCIMGGFKVGLREQLGNLTYVGKFKDLSLFILSFLFLQGGANTAVSVAAIFTVEILHLPVRYVAGCMLLGLAAAILGLGFYKSLHTLGIITAKQILLINMTVLGFGMLFALYVQSATDIYLLAVICGSQIGTVGAYSRSIISTLVPKTRQSRLFSFYEFTQDGTHWVGPMLISTLTAVYGDVHYRKFVVFVCIVEILLGVPILAMVDVSRGEAARANADSLEEIAAKGIDYDGEQGAIRKNTSEERERSSHGDRSSINSGSGSGSIFRSQHNSGSGSRDLVD